MAQYTMTLKQIIENKINIFNFDYPIFNEEYRPIFEQKFIKHFYFREIGVETVGRFIYNLDEQLNLIMPYYNKLYKSQLLEQRILDNYDVTEEFQKTSKNKTNSTGENLIDKTNKSDLENRNLYSATPNKRIDISSNDFVTNITKDIGVTNATTNQTETATNNIVDDGEEKWTRTMKGNIGVQTDADAVIKYESSLRNIDVEVFRELENLFMLVY